MRASVTHIGLSISLAASSLAMPQIAHAAEQTCAAPILVEDMESDTPLRRALTRHELLSLAEDDGNTRLVTQYVGNEHGSARVIVAYPLPVFGTDYTLQYDVWLPEDFQFVLGGKMHGFGPANYVAGGMPLQPDGWSSRVMWRKGGEPVNYVYHQNQPGKYGEDGKGVGKPWFTPGKWHAVALHVVLNQEDGTPGSSRVYIDGQLVNVLEDITYRTVFSEDTLISRFRFSTFFGGNSPEWAPKDEDGNYITLEARYDNFAVYPGLCLDRN